MASRSDRYAASKLRGQEYSFDNMVLIGRLDHRNGIMGNLGGKSWREGAGKDMIGGGLLDALKF
ncbi:unnamed protein product [Clonostachys chloroleuca]|uniref:Uncharacterized protein n=1 Tax=Clonostachys chloroleuca TaxID=1926264 RepID=A0AA35VQ18_9HYPO|nr:unnamed protein product [Clonostachys chloroleuca]